MDHVLKKGDTGVYAWGGDRARVTLIHDSPPDQEAVEVVLLEDFICKEAGEIIEIQRREFASESIDQESR